MTDSREDSAGDTGAASQRSTDANPVAGPRGEVYIPAVVSRGAGRWYGRFDAIPCVAAGWQRQVSGRNAQTEIEAIWMPDREPRWMRCVMTRLETYEKVVVVDSHRDALEVG